MKSKITGIILTLVGVAGLIYAAIAQFTDGMAKQPVAGILLVSIIVVFIGVSQLYKKHPDEY
jgi:uncharacterized membrane protein